MLKFNLGVRRVIQVTGTGWGQNISLSLSVFEILKHTHTYFSSSAFLLGLIQ
jgi:hypothetical protein